MKTYRYEQFLCCSSEKSLSSGYSGFGVRAKSPGLSVSDADTLYGRSSLQYGLPSDMGVTEDVLRANPHLDALYPHRYAFLRVRDEADRERFVVARVMYVGGEYGFFENLDSNNRVGSNYIGHALVFDEMPPVAVLAQAVAQGAFLPRNTECSFANEEFRRILRGEPFDLPAGEITVPDSDGFTPDSLTGAITTALLQDRANRAAGSDVKGVILRVPVPMVDWAIASLAHILPSLTDGLFFNANFIGQATVYGDIGMIIVNDTDRTEMAEDYNIVVNVGADGKVAFKNVQSNFLFDRIADAASAGDLLRLNLVAELCMQIGNDKGVDLEQAYRMLILAKTPDMPSVDEVASLDFKFAASHSLPDGGMERVWQKVNDSLQGAFVYPLSLNNIKLSLDSIAMILRFAPQRLVVTPDQAEVLMNLLFASDENFQRVIEGNADRRRTVIHILRSIQSKPSENAFFRSMFTSSSSAEWDDFLRYFFGDGYASGNCFEKIVTDILSSDFKDRKAVVEDLFPVNRNSERWLWLVSDVPDFYSAVSAGIDDYVSKRMAASPQQAMDFVLDLNPDLIRQLPLKSLAHTYVSALMRQPSMIDFPKLESTAASLGQYGVTDPAIARAIDIHASRPVDKVVPADLDFALALSAPKDYVHTLFEGWIANMAVPADVAAFISKVSLSAPQTAAFLDAFWKATAASDKGGSFVFVTDKLGLKGHTLKDVIPLLKQPEAAALLQKESGFFRKFSRKIFGGKLGVLMALAAIMSLASCGGDPEMMPVDEPLYINPYRLDMFGYQPSTEQVKSSDFSKTHTLINIYTRRFTPRGDLQYSAKYNSKGGIDSVSYVFNSYGKIVSVLSNDSYDYTPFYNADNKLYQMMRSRAPDGSGNVLEIEYYFYDNRDRVSEIKVTDGADHDLSRSVFTYAYDESLARIENWDYTNSVYTLTAFRKDYGNVNSVISSVETFDMRNGSPSSTPKSVANYQYTGTGDLSSGIKQTVKITNSYGSTTRIFENEISFFPPGAVAEYAYPSGDGGSAYPADEYGAGYAHDPDLYEALTYPAPPEKSGNFIADWFRNIRYRYILNNRMVNSPGGWLLLVVALITGVFTYKYFMVARRRGWIKQFRGYPDKNGMYRMWMFNYEPYLDVAIGIGTFIVGFLSAILVLLAVGLVILLLLWIVKLLLIILIWAGWAAVIIGGLCCLGGQFVGCLPLIIGGLIVSWEDGMRRAGDAMVAWGSDFMDSVNLFNWVLSLFGKFWDVLLTVFLAPMVIFLGFCLVAIALIFLLKGFEWCMTKFYGIRRPCPVCGSTKDKEYWADRHNPHPVPLTPGVYGVFHHTNPRTGLKLPTMLIMGKDKLLRKCRGCGNMITAGEDTSYGTEKHVGIVGNTSFGKSYLTYTLLYRILSMFGDKARQIDAAKIDANNSVETDIVTKYNEIQSGRALATNRQDAYRAVQLIIEQKLRPVPWHLFFYDVAGEKFDQVSTASKTAMDFYRNVNQIVFLIDPSRVDYSYSPCSDKMQEWLSRNAQPPFYSVDGTLSTLKSILERVGRNPKDIDLAIVLVKSDMGYAQHCGYPVTASDETVKRFIQAELGLGNLVNSAQGTFRKVEFDMVNIRPSYCGSIDTLALRLLHNLGIK